MTAGDPGSRPPDWLVEITEALGSPEGGAALCMALGIRPLPCPLPLENSGVFLLAGSMEAPLALWTREEIEVPEGSLVLVSAGEKGALLCRSGEGHTRIVLDPADPRESDRRALTALRDGEDYGQAATSRRFVEECIPLFGSVSRATGDREGSLTLFVDLVMLSMPGAEGEGPGDLWERYRAGGRYGTDRFAAGVAAPSLAAALQGCRPPDSLDVPDRFCKNILEIIERYRFTCREETPAEQEAAVGPEAIALLTEHLAPAGDHSLTGVFYTPVAEVWFMCRRALVEALSVRLPEVGAEALYALVFSQSAAGLPDRARALAALDEITAIDPACGSGSFLVGMLGVLEETARALGGSGIRTMVRAVGEGLHGTDVMPAAVRAAGLRLLLRLRAGEGGGAASPWQNLRVGDTLAAPWEGCFDIVIGNPPYVRQELIAPPGWEGAGTHERQAYKDALIQKAGTVFPALGRPDRRSDLYIYFFLCGLAMLRRPGGILCFITPTTWLDTAYGSGLQEFLLRNVPIIAVYDLPGRTFAGADVNTVITLLGSPSKESDRCLGHPARFVRVAAPPGDRDLAGDLAAVERARPAARDGNLAAMAGNLVKVGKCRAFPALQADLLEEGRDTRDGRYAGSAWTGKFLRAPEIFYTVLRKGQGLFVRIGEVAPFRRGMTTGANAFFYLDRAGQDRWGIEDEFLVPVIKSPRECLTTRIDPAALQYRAFVCTRGKDVLAGTGAGRYIERGEERQVRMRERGERVGAARGYQNFRSFETKKRWYALEPKGGTLFWMKETYERLGCFVSETEILCDCRFYCASAPVAVQNAVNSTLALFLAETLSRSSLGLGARSLMVYEVNRLPVPAGIEGLSGELLLEDRKLGSVFEECGIDPGRPIRDQRPGPLPDRARLDALVFEAFGLTPAEQEEVYLALCEMVLERTGRARSLGGHPRTPPRRR
ncbi:hypothetical protein E2N92_10150 [Methanofollis formosanus]|uniref:site-specific DNA-methyltransferase (adenine-specific) n=1 Tax=Methanofollis formosanus TaxID=299308 RepID=A0A8G1A3J8_9EURY|nr:Eco57I restriction-modification methylase domain-containing protein [Methanofollis formosanus]QYZ79764.1 hypothetical protein E2N92_10150 [Methanofollis formosanus]